MFGFLNVYKPKGLTSHDVVARLRRITKIKQIGHTGTLDPFAQGVLPVCIGKATRLIEYLADDKAYEGVIQFGVSTTTYDTEGDVVSSSKNKVSAVDVEKALSSFRGEIEQKPPIYSAIKKDGKKLYEYARKGEEVEIPTRKVEIYRLELLNFEEEKQQARIYIECSKGTYIRSIANDVGQVLGVYGHLIELLRVKAGMFELSETCDLDNLDNAKVQERLLNPLMVLDFAQQELLEKDLIKVKNGMKLPTPTFNEGEFVLLTYKGNLASVAQVENAYFVQKKVFID